MNSKLENIIFFTKIKTFCSKIEPCCDWYEKVEERNKGYLISDEGDGLLAAEQTTVAMEEALWSE